MSAAAELLERLRRARASHLLLDDSSPHAGPTDLNEAYAIAAQVMDGVAIAGWKIGATSPRGLAMLGLAEPFFGRVAAHRVLHSPADCAADAVGYAVEAEIAFIMGRDLPPRAQPYGQDEVMEAVDAIAPALELNRPSYSRPFDVGGLALIADNGVNDGACLGARTRDWRSLDLSALSVEIVRDAEPALHGRASSVLGDPRRALTWLANALGAHGAFLARGHVVLSGAMMQPLDVRPGQSVHANFSQLGPVVLRIVHR